MTIQQIKAVLDREPMLNAAGYGTGWFPQDQSIEDRVRAFQENRADLRADVYGCTRAEKWLAGIEKTKTINDKHSSYGLKHMVEKEFGYITNGAFIVAAIHCGFWYTTDRGSLNVAFNMSEKSIRAKHQAVSAGE